MHAVASIMLADTIAVKHDAQNGTLRGGIVGKGVKVISHTEIFKIVDDTNQAICYTL